METKVLDTAKELLNGDRAKAYGDVITNYKAIADIANIMLRRKNKFLDIEDIGIILVALKIAREGNSHKDDNLIDAAAYLNILKIMHDKVDNTDTFLQECNKQKKALNYIINKTESNIVSCGNCGATVIHNINETTVECPYCKHKGDVCDFPDIT